MRLLLSHLVSALLQPLAWCGLLMGLSWWGWRRHPRAARKALGLALLLGLVVGWQPPVDALLRGLEDRYPAPASLPPDCHGVVVLGGALEPDHIQAGRPQVALNAAAERMTMAVALMRQQPQMRLLFTGGNPSLQPGDVTEAAQAAQFFLEQGLPAARLPFEHAARSTDENARLSAALPGVNPQQCWLLLTSAWHMPRAMASFRAAGWHVQPYPVDYRTGRETPWTAYSLWRGAERWQLWLHERVGLAAYQLLGQATR